MADLPYTDKNGVRWTIVSTESAVFAYPDKDSPRKYADAPDLGPIAAQKGDRPGAQQIDGIKLVVEAYAGQHAREVALEVPGHRDSGAGWVILVLLLLAAMDDDGR